MPPKTTKIAAAEPIVAAAVAAAPEPVAIAVAAAKEIDLVDAEIAAAYAEELREAGAHEVFPISGATGQGIEALLDAVIAHLPARTVTERPQGEQEDAGDSDWSPL